MELVSKQLGTALEKPLADIPIGPGPNYYLINKTRRIPSIAMFGRGPHSVSASLYNRRRGSGSIDGGIPRSASLPSLNETLYITAETEKTVEQYYDDDDDQMDSPLSDDACTLASTTQEPVYPVYFGIPVYIPNTTSTMPARKPVARYNDDDDDVRGMSLFKNELRCPGLGLPPAVDDDGEESLQCSTHDGM